MPITCWVQIISEGKCAHMWCVCVKQDRELATLLREGHAYEDLQRTLLATVWAQQEPFARVLCTTHTHAQKQKQKNAQAAHILFFKTTATWRQRVLLEFMLCDSVQHPHRVCASRGP